MARERLTRARRRAQTREQLLDAAAEVFARRGFHAATLDEIADAAGFSKGAVYSNFASKDDLFLALISARGTAMVEAYAELGADTAADPSSRIAALAEIYQRGDPDLTQQHALFTEFELYALRRPEILALLNGSNRAIRARVVAIVEEQAANRGRELPLPAEDLAALYQAIFQGLWHARALDPSSVPDDLAARAIVFIDDALEALGPKRARRR
jgi:AcrR family transcriptional regulator